MIAGRSNMDNVLVASEIIHCLKSKRSGGFEELSLKVDINKAKDRINWGYLRVVMIKIMESNLVWVKKIMLCVKTVHY